jgi:hypothetical protein|nr:MAG TPA: putative HD superfamily hydrolase [Caudoviricetes sp.]
MTDKERLDFMMATNLSEIVKEDFLKWLAENGFFTAPASTKYHGNYEGGLFDHSFMVMNLLVELSAANGLKWKRPASPFLVGMFHDLCKIDQYRIDSSTPYTVGEPTRYEYNPNTMYKGHGDKSIILLSQFTTLTDEETACIRYHMGAFTEKEEWRDYTRAVHAFPNVLWTHQADMLASHVVGI